MASNWKKSGVKYDTLFCFESLSQQKHVIWKNFNVLEWKRDPVIVSCITKRTDGYLMGFIELC